MNIQKPKNDIELFRDTEIVQRSLKVAGSGTLNQTLATIAGGTRYDVLLVRLSYSSEYTSALVYSLVDDDDNAIWQKWEDGSTSTPQQTVISAPEAIKLEPGQAIKLKINNAVNPGFDFFINYALMRFRRD